MIFIQTEEDRKNEAIRFIKSKIEDLSREIADCDYTEDVNGDPVFTPDSYPEEKRTFQHEKRQWEIMLNIMTMTPPFHTLDF